MRVLITGGAGFIGQKLCARILQQGKLLTAAGAHEVSHVTVLDQAPVSLAPDERLTCVVGNAGDPAVLARALAPGADVVFHLAAVVSVAAERHFDLGYSINLAGTMALLDLCRKLPRPPHFIMASSAAVYGGPLPSVVNEQTALFPQTSYGTQKAIAELLVGDYSRKGLLVGCCLRLPTVVVRPGRPNLAASSFASSVVREPLMGRSFVCPVPATTPVCLISVRNVVDSFVHAASLSRSALGHTPAVQLPGITLTVADMVDAMRARAGAGVADRVSFEPQEDVVSIVNGWPAAFDARRARALGFGRDVSADQIIADFINDELAGKVVA